MKAPLLLLFAIIFFSCKSEDTGTIPKIDLLSQPESEITNLSDIATDVNYIPLQTSDSSLIRWVYNLQTRNDKLYIYTHAEILCFDNSGKFLYKLSRQGRGPEEYAFISDFDLSTENNLLITLVNKKIMIYNVTGKGFVFLKALNFKVQPHHINFSPDQKSVLLSYGSTDGNEPYRNVLISLTGDTLKVIPNSYKYTKITKMFFASAYENIQFKHNSTLNFKFWLSDTVFALNQLDEIVPYMIFDSHGKQTTTEALANFSDGTWSEFLSVNIIMETLRYILYQYSFEKTSYYRIYDKVKNETFGKTLKTLNDTKWITDDIIGGADFEPKFCENGNLYSWVDALTLKKHIAGEGFKNSVVKNPEKKVALKKLADSLNETDNPVLIVVTPKE